LRRIIKAKGIVDVTREAMLNDSFLAIEDGKIIDVSDQENLRTFPEKDEIVDFSDNYVLPGLINCHTHAVIPAVGFSIEEWLRHTNETFLLTAANNIKRSLISGVTTIRDCGGRDNVMFELRKALEMGIIEGSRLILSGRLLTITGGHGYQFHGEVDGPDLIRKEIRKLVKEGADFIKIVATGGTTVGSRQEFASFDLSEMTTAADVAHQLGKTITAHCVGVPGMRNAIDAGVDHMEHACFMQEDGRQRFDRKLADKMAEKEIYVTPTLRVYQDVVETLKQKEESGLISPDEKVTLEEWKRMLEESVDCYRGLLAAGIKCVAGNDAGFLYTSFDKFWQELEMMVMGGMTPMQSIVSATKTAAEAMTLDHQIGSLEVGKKADLIVVNDDPTADISSLSKVLLVMKEGKIYKGP
jgi:imidazolonepropionase-like amidohydrolase